MWKISALALLTATLMAGSMQQPASAQGYRGACDMRILQHSDGSNRAYPRGWVHDPVTQKWLAPNSYEAQLACQHQMEINARQQQGDYADRYYSNQRKEFDAGRELRASGDRGRCDFRILTRNGSSNPQMPPDWVHDPVTQAWLEPNSAQAELACVHQQEVNAQQANPQGSDRGYGRR